MENSNSNALLWGGVLVAIVIAGISLFASFRDFVPSAGGSGSRFPNGVSANSTSPSAGQLLGTTMTVTGAATLSTASMSGLLTLSGGLLKGNVNSTSTIAASAQTLVLADVNGYDTLVLTPNVAGISLTLFASSTAATFLPTVGLSQTTCILNGTTTAGVNITLAGGTGTTLLVASSSAATLGSLVIGPQKMGCLTFTRGNATATTFDLISTFTTFK